jgi:hypothetical protein
MFEESGSEGAPVNYQANKKSSRLQWVDGIAVKGAK